MQPTIYLGLGGTGNLGISYAKKLFLQEGEIPDHIAFLGIDFQTNMDDDPNLASDIHDDFINLSANANPRQVYEVGKDQHGLYQWMFRGNVMNIAQSIADGASQVRTTGRLYTEMVLEKIMARLVNTINTVRSVASDSDINASVVNIHMVMSIAGGTGAGSFISLANAIRERYGNKVKLFGYGISHNVFKAMDPQGTKTPNVELNTISSIIDMDYLMTASDESPIEIKTRDIKTTLTSPIFDLFYVVDNTSQSGFVVKNIKNLSEIVGTCLYSCGSEVGDKLNNVINNIGPSQGNHNVGSKLGWVQSLGACQVIYSGDILAKLYSLKASNILIKNMMNDDIDELKAKDWAKAKRILEDGEEFNLLTDDIYSPKAINSVKLPNIDAKQTEKEINEVTSKYFLNLADFPTKDVLASKTNELKSEIRKQVEAYLATDNGVGNSIKFLNGLYTICSRDKIEMENEASQLKVSIEEKNEQFAKAYSRYKEEEKAQIGFLTRNKDEKKNAIIEDTIAAPARTIMREIYELKRREAARDIFIALIAEIEVLSTQLKEISQKLTNLSKSYTEEIIKLSSASSDAMIFEYDLSYNERQNVTVDSETVVVADFIKKLGKSLLDVDVNIELNDRIMAYTSSLDKAKEYNDKLITDVIDQLSDEEYVKLKKEIGRKADRWLSIDDRGQAVLKTGNFVSDAISSNWLVTYYRAEDNASYMPRFEKDKSFLPDVAGKDFLPIQKDIAKQRMIFCRLEGSIIPYCIGFLDELAMGRYQKCINGASSGDMVFVPHFDKTLFEKMRSEDFKLKPEMKNESIFYWVCSQLFGFTTIKEEERIMEYDEKGNPVKDSSKELADHTKYVCWYKGKYVYWDVNALPGKDAQWKSLDNTKRRDTAYNYFKTIVLPEQKENFKKLIATEFARRQEYWKLRIQEVAQRGFHDYINKIVCSDKNSLTYFSKETGGEVQILQQEFKYIQDDLINALLNLK